MMDMSRCENKQQQEHAVGVTQRSQKKDTREKKRLLGEKTKYQPIAEGCPGKGQCEIVDPGANTKAVFQY